jgi:Tfp pilus assembly protein PilF
LTEAIRLGSKVGWANVIKGGEATTYVYRGWSYTKKGEYDKAVADLSEAIRIDPKRVQAYECRAAAYRAKGDLDKAASDERKAQKLRK